MIFTNKLKITIVFLMLCDTLFSQNMNGTKVMGMPLVFIMPEEGSRSEGILSIMPGTVWRINANRINTPTYISFDGKVLKEKLNFLETLYVIDEKGDFLHVYSEPAHDPTVGTLSKKAVDRGWIHKSDGLLWRHCLINSQDKQNLQTMTLSQTGLLEMGEFGHEATNGVTVFSDPELTNKTVVTSRIKQLYYIYDIHPKSFLIGLNRKITAENEASKVILGWVPINYCFVLKNRVWLEPNQESNAIEERNEKKIIPALFADEVMAKNFQLNLPVCKTCILWQDNRQVSYPPTWFRFPLIMANDGIQKVRIVDADFTIAYATLKTNNLQNNLFTQVTLISNFELNSVILNMNKLIEASVDFHNRKAIQQSIVNLLEEEYNGIDEEQGYNLTFRQIFENLFWFCSSDQKLAVYKLRAFTDLQKVSDNIVSAFIEELKIKVKELSRIATVSMNEYSFFSNDSRYFWIDINHFL